MMRKVLFILSVAFTMLVGSTPAFASVSDDQVTSQKIREADGTSGQNTNSGSGVKTGHIQNSAVTSGKIADGAVSSTKILDSAVASSKIQDGAVTDAKITGPISGSKLGTHTHNGSDVVDGTISTSKIQDGAVTDAKITGPISGSKISSTGLNADTVDGQHASAFATASHTQAMSTVTGLEAALAGKSDVTHNHDTLYQQKYGQVAVVAKTGGDYTDPVAAMNDIATWCGTPSAANPCLVKIMPGVYDLSNTTLHVGPYIDVEGSGEGTTILSSSTLPVVSVGSAAPVAAGASAEIRNLKIDSTAVGEANNAAFDFSQYGSGLVLAKLHRVTIASSNIVAILNRGWGVGEITDSTLISSDPSIYGGGRMFTMFSGTATLKNVTMKGSIDTLGTYNIKIFNSIIDGAVNVPDSGTLNIFNSQVRNVSAGGLSFIKCINVINMNFDPYNCTRL